MEPHSHNGTLERSFTIGEAADILGVAVSTVRLYEREGLIIPQRRSSKHRRYSDADIERLRCIRRMINGEKISIAGIRRLLSMNPCWKIKNCPNEVRVSCPAFMNSRGPCWTESKKSWECRSAECRVCPVYTRISDCKTLKMTIATFTLGKDEGDPLQS